jgi:hypothetical protein
MSHSASSRLLPENRLLKVGDFIPIEIFYRDEVIPDPKKPTRVVPMDAFVSPKWAKRELFVEMIKQAVHPMQGARRYAGRE